MSADARAALELSKEGRHFLDLVEKCPDSALGAEIIAAGARLLTVGANGKENALPAPAAPDLKSVLLSLKALSFVNPRGRFDLMFSRNALCISNTKGNILVPTELLTHVAILDQIPQDTKKRCLLFLVLDRNGPAIMNGKQRLDVVIIQTLEADTLKVAASNGEVLEGPVVAVLCQAVGMCIPNFTNFLAPQPDLYRSIRGHVAVSAVVKVNHGHLFPLPGAVLFAERPAIFVPHRDILAVEYRRPQSATFDLVLHTRPPGAQDCSDGAVQQIEFSQIQREELGRLHSYFNNCKIKLYDPAAPPRLGGGGSTAAGPSHGASASAGALQYSAHAGSGSGSGNHGVGPDADSDEDEDDEDFDPSVVERSEGGRRPTKRFRRDPSLGSGAGPSTAGPSRRQDVHVDTEGGEEHETDEDEEGEGEDEDEDEDSDSDEDEDEDELADLTDEDDLRADDVRHRVRHGSGAPMGTAAGGRGGSGKRPRDVETEEEEEDYEDEDD